MSVTARIAASPSREACQDAWKAGKPSVVFSVEPADLLTPVSAYMRLAGFDGGTGRYTLLLESVEGGVSRGRYSVIALKPDLVWTCHNGQVTVDENPAQPDTQTRSVDGAALDSLRSLIRDTQLDLPAGLPPMIAGLFGYLGYDMVRQMEYLPDAPPDDLNLPEAVMMRPGLFAVLIRSVMSLFSRLRSARQQGKTPGQRGIKRRLFSPAHAPVWPGLCPLPLTLRRRWRLKHRTPHSRAKSSVTSSKKFRTTSLQGMPFRLFPVSVFLLRLRCRLWRCIALCAASTRHRSCSIWILGRFRSWGHRLKFWCGCVTAP